MEDNLKFFKNGRRLQIFQKWKTTLIFFKNGRGPQFFKNERQPRFFQKWKMTSTFSKMEEDLNFSEWKTTPLPPPPRDDAFPIQT